MACIVRPLEILSSLTLFLVGSALRPEFEAIDLSAP
jgi:hypothetical protein